MSYANPPPASRRNAPLYQSAQASGYGYQAADPYLDYSQAPAFRTYPPVSVHALSPRPSNRCQFLKTTLKLVLFHILNTLLGQVGFVLLVAGVSISIGLLPLCCFGLVLFRLVLFLVSGLAQLDVTLYNFIAPPAQHVHLQLPPPDLLVAGDRLAPKLSNFSPKSLMALFYLLTVKFAVSLLSVLSVLLALLAPIIAICMSSDPDGHVKIQLGDDAIAYDSAPAAFVIATACLTIIGVALMHAAARLSRTTTLFFCCEKFSYYSPIHAQPLGEAYNPVATYGSKGF